MKYVNRYKWYKLKARFCILLAMIVNRPVMTSPKIKIIISLS